MIVDISIPDAYSLVKDWDIARGWKPHAMMILFNKEWERNEYRCVDLVNTLIDWSHYESLKELIHDYPKDYEDMIEEGFSFKSLAEDGDEEADKEGRKLEYLVQTF
tara:strand:- start:443 stop:760 length:318 start_codon:yes stop_codon:yes gene_type:complete